MPGCPADAPCRRSRRRGSAVRSWLAGTAPVAGPGLSAGVSSVATIPVPFPQESPLRVRVLPSRGFHRVPRYYDPVRLLNPPRRLDCRLVHRVCEGHSQRTEVSRVQRVPVITCRPCYPGGARRCVWLSTFPTRMAFAHFVEARPPHVTSTRLRLSSLRATARRLRSCRIAIRQHPGSASAGPLTVSRREPGYPMAQRLIGVGSFHPTRNAPLHGAHKVELAGWSNASAARESAPSEAAFDPS